MASEDGFWKGALAGAGVIGAAWWLDARAVRRARAAQARSASSTPTPAQVPGSGAVLPSKMNPGVVRDAKVKALDPSSLGVPVSRWPASVQERVAKVMGVPVSRLPYVLGVY